MHNEPTTLKQTSFEAHTLTLRLIAALRSTMFGSRLTITPRRMGMVADEFTVFFQRYVEAQHDEDHVQDFGRRLARDGLGHSAALSLVGTLHEYTEEIRAIHPELSGHVVRFMMPLLAGYMAAREEHLLSEQELTRRALDRAREQATS